MSRTAFFTNGVSSQLPPPGTVARSEPIPTLYGPVYPFEDAPVNTGLDHRHDEFCRHQSAAGERSFASTRPERFDIYCAPCHGRLGDGNGITKKIGDMPAVANLHDKRVVELSDGEIFNTITKGKGL